jgi:HEPN domain-containing protein
MMNQTLAQAYLRKATDRLDILDLLHTKEAYSDEVREAQEIGELALKGMLRPVGVEPPKYHEVGNLLLEHSNRFPKEVARQLKKGAKISKKLAKEMELAFDGEIDFISTEEYTSEASREARKDAQWIVALAKKVIVLE